MRIVWVAGNHQPKMINRIMKTLAQLRDERRSLVKQLIKELDSLAHSQSRGIQTLTQLSDKLEAKQWRSEDLDRVDVLADQLAGTSRESATIVDRLTAAIRALSSEITLRRTNQRIDPPIAVPETPVEPPTAAGRPGEDLDWGVKEKPTRDDMDWIYEAGIFTSQRGLGETTSWGDAYRMSRTDGVVNPHFGIIGRVASEVIVGGKWGGGDSELTFPGDAEASATFLGLTDDASARIAWGSHFNNAQPTGEIAIFDCGIQGRPDQHIMNAKMGARHCQLDGCWYVHWDPAYTYPADAEPMSEHSVSMGSTDVLVIRNHKWRGEQPTDSGLYVRYYSDAYVHGQTISYLFENNDCRGGNRGGMQNRPDAFPYGKPSTDPRPSARVMIRNNRFRFDGAGLDFTGTQVIGLWSALGGCYLYDNDFEDYPAAGIVTSGQTPEQNYWTESGNQFPFLHLSGNRIVSGPNTRRAALNLSSIDELHIYDDNEIVGQVQLDAKWNYERNGSMIERIHIHAAAVPEWMMGANRYDVATGKTIRYTSEELQAMLVEVPTA